jgi:diguanylate cyclase (GGDEF)-like protein/PAS domain S-box-containing protein
MTAARSDMDPALAKDAGTFAGPSATKSVAFERDLLASQVRLLMADSADVPVNLINATVVAAVGATLLPAAIPALWLVAVYVVVLSRPILRRAFRRADPGPDRAQLWARRWTAGVLALGCLWGLAGLSILVIHDPIRMLFMFFVLGGMVAGGLVSNAAYLPAAYAFTLPVIAPALVCLLSRLQPTTAFMALMLASFAVLLTFTARNINRSIVTNFTLTIQQAILTKKLLASEAVMAEAQEIACLGSWHADLVTGAVDCSIGTYKLLGLDPTGPPPTGADIVALAHPEDRKEIARVIVNWLKSDVSQNLDQRIVLEDGAVKWIQAIGRRTVGRTGRAIALDVVMQDITRRKESERELEIANTILSTQIDSSPDGILVMDPQGRIICANAMFWNIWHISGAEIETVTGEFLMERIASMTVDPRSTLAGVNHLLENPEEHSFRLNILKDGRFVERHSHVLLTSNGANLGRAWFFRDVTERKRAEAEALRRARFDALTGLANRGVFVEALHQAIAQEKRGRKGFAVIYLDLDHFKDVNDTLGHPIGDELLKAVAERLRANTRESDTVGRFGGDEFALVAGDVTAAADVALLADKLIKVISDPYTIQGNVIYCGASIGIDLYGPDAADAETLLSHADVALYRAKADGRGSYRFFTNAMDAEVRKRVELASELRTALERDELFLLYQPQVEATTGRITGVEALVRWRHPTRGVLGPGVFIPIAEEMGLMVGLGRWVLWQACRQARVWLDLPRPAIRMAVNVSAIQFKAPMAFEADILDILEKTGVPPSFLELELTETVLMKASSEHGDVLRRLTGTGLRMAIDDFGTGYSSLAYLREFPADRIKIAQTFVTNLGAAGGDAAIVKATIGLASELGICVIAEGVEKQEQFDLLKAWGCEEIQGYYFARPMPPDDVTDLLKSNRNLLPAAEGSVRGS